MRGTREAGAGEGCCDRLDEFDVCVGGAVGASVSVRKGEPRIGGVGAAFYATLTTLGEGATVSWGAGGVCLSVETGVACGPRPAGGVMALQVRGTTPTLMMRPTKKGGRKGGKKGC